MGTKRDSFLPHSETLPGTDTRALSPSAGVRSRWQQVPLLSRGQRVPRRAWTRHPALQTRGRQVLTPVALQVILYGMSKLREFKNLRNATFELVAQKAGRRFKPLTTYS